MIVMKFGGTSIDDAVAVQRVVEIVRSRLPLRPVVVVSAMGKTTKQLLETARAASGGDLKTAAARLEALRTGHEELAQSAVRGWKGSPGETRVQHYFREMDQLLGGFSVLGELSLRSQDKMLSYGELVSTSILDEAFRENGVPSVWMDSRTLVITDEGYTRASPVWERTRDSVRGNVVPLLGDGRVPVLQGYIGASTGGATTTLGFEGSDYSATLVGAALGASEIQIWKEVSGVMTADPDRVPGAWTVAHVSYEEASQLTYLGAKVLHTKSIGPARRHGIPIRVGNSTDADAPCSVVGDRSPADGGFVKSIAYKTPVALVRLVSPSGLEIHAFVRTVLERLHDASIEPIAWNAARDRITCVIGQESGWSGLPAVMENLADVTVFSDQAAVSLVGEGIRTQGGFAGRVLAALDGVDVPWVSHGSSGIGITAVVGATVLDTVLKRLHGDFFRSPDPGMFIQPRKNRT